MLVALGEGYRAFGSGSKISRGRRRRRPLLRHWRRRLRLAWVDGSAVFYSPRIRQRLILALLLLALCLFMLPALAGDEHRSNVPDTGTAQPEPRAPRPPRPSAEQDPDTITPHRPQSSIAASAPGHVRLTPLPHASTSEPAPTAPSSVASSRSFSATTTPADPHPSGTSDATVGLRFGGGRHGCRWVLRGAVETSFDVRPGEQRTLTVTAEELTRLDIEADRGDCRFSVLSRLGDAVGSIDPCRIPFAHDVGDLLIGCD